MARWICIACGAVHLLAMAISTYAAAIEIESILITGVICSLTGIATGVAASWCGRRRLAAAGFSLPLIAVTLFVLEAIFLNLGPGRAALPFCIVFIINQALATLVILVELNILVAPAGAIAWQITIRTLLVSMVSFSVFFAVARQLLKREHDWIMALALGLLGLAFVGLCVLLFAAFANRERAPVVS